MEGLLRLSKLKLQLLALISENKGLRERERCAMEELRLFVQRQREAEAESTVNFQELREELASRDALQRKLETRIKCLENDNVLLEKKQKELRFTLDDVLKSRDTFVNIYKDSTCVLKNAIEVRDRKLSILSDKIQRHLSLFDFIEKEAEAVKQTVDSVQELVREKEQIVTRLKEKMDKFSTFEKDFVEKICSMESELANCRHELQRKDVTLFELKEQLEATKNDVIFQSQVEEKTILIKDEIIQNLTSEKKDLHLELLNMELMLQKIQDTTVKCTEWDQNAKSSPLEGQLVTTACAEENGRLGKMRKVMEEGLPSKIPKVSTIENPVSIVHQEDISVIDTASNRNIGNSCSSELAHSSQSVYLCPQSVTSVINTSTDGENGCAPAMECLDSESSTTEAEAVTEEAA